MKKSFLLAGLLAAAGGCDMTFENPHLGVRGLTEADVDPNAPPGKNQIRAAIINDIRDRRQLHLKLEEGRPTMPEDIKLDMHRVQAVRSKDEAPLWRIDVRVDPPDRLNAVCETAYWDNDANSYYYHYEGGHPYREIWFGPMKIKFPKPIVPDEHDH